MAVQPQQVSRCASQLLQHQPGLDGERVVISLTSGLGNLRNLLFRRLHQDVNSRFGDDSLMMPISDEHFERMEAEAKREIDLYAIALTAEEVELRQYAGADCQWFLPWLCDLHLGEPANQPAVQQRLAEYRELTGSKRRRAFQRRMEGVMASAKKAPLVAYRLFPSAIRLATALAFNDQLRAGELRNDQQMLLPAIADCHDCHGSPLDNEETCHTCGNPMWNFDWLCAD